MKKILQSFIAVLTLTMVLTGCEPEETETVSVYLPEVITQVLEPGLRQQFEATGEVFAHKISRLTAEQRAQVDQILAKNGDMVSQGQDLVVLRSSEISSAFQNAGTNLQNARISLSETELSGKTAIESAQIALDTAQVNLQNTLRQNRVLKKQAEETFNAAKVSTDLSVTSAETNFENAIKNVKPVVQTAINSADKLMGVSPTYKFSNDSFENNLGAINNAAKRQAETSVQLAINAQNSYVEDYLSSKNLLSVTETALQDTVTVLNNTLVGSNYTQDTLNADLNTITAQLTSVRTTISSLDSAQNALNTALQDSDGESQTLINARAAYEATLTQLDSAEDTARKSVQSAQNSLENARRSAELSRLGAKTSVDSAFGAYDQARITQNKLTLKAPFTGKIVDVFVKQGEEVNPGTPLLTLEDDRELTVVSYLSEQDRANIKVGDRVFVNEEIHLITSISPSADPVTKKYKVELDMESQNLRPGSFVNLTFEIAEEVFDGDRLFVPIPSLLILPEEIYVWTVENKKTVRTPIRVGEVIGDYVEVLDGLDIGDQVIVEGGRLIEDEGTRVRIQGEPGPKIPNS